MLVCVSLFRPHSRLQRRMFVSFFLFFFFLIWGGWVGEGVARVIPFFTCEHLLRFAVDIFFKLLLFWSYLLIIVRGVFLSSFYNFNVLFVTIIGMKHPVIHLDRLVDRFFLLFFLRNCLFVCVCVFFTFFWLVCRQKNISIKRILKIYFQQFLSVVLYKVLLQAIFISYIYKVFPQAIFIL